MIDTLKFYPFEVPGKGSMEEKIQRDMETCSHLRFLVNCEAGRWLLAKLMNEGYQFGPIPRFGDNRDNAIQGRYDLIESTITTPILRLLGPEALGSLNLRNVKGK